MLSEFWSKCTYERAPFVHPEDELVLRAHCAQWLDLPQETFKSYLSSPSFGSDEDRFHFSLLPVPYAGNLRQADIFILLLNPGFIPADYYVEYERPEWRHRVLRNLAQDFHGTEFPNLNLDPEYCWTGAYGWWERKLRPVARKIAHERYDGNYREALRALSERVASIELVPYHSTRFAGHKLLQSLPSARCARRYVQDVLLPQAEADKISIIVTRQVGEWGLKGNPQRSIVHYTGGETRAASLGPDTTGGMEILRRFGLSTAGR